VQAARRRSTIIEVAARANVAFSTVSRVLNGGYASPEVRARVEAAARELNYTPSSIARNLKTGRQGVIGVVVESSQCSWFTQVLGGIEEALEQKLFSLLLGSLALRGRYDSSVINRWISERRVDGLIFIRCTRHEESLVSQARQAQLLIAVDASNNAAVYARSQYRAGLIDFLSLLQSEQALLSARDQLASARADQSLALVQLYLALGGGWQPTTSTGNQSD